MSSHAKKFCVCGHSMGMHPRSVGGALICSVLGCEGCDVYEQSRSGRASEPSPDLIKAAAVSSVSHLRLSIGALRDVEKGEDESAGISAAYWRQKLEAIVDLLESDLRGVK